MVNVLLSNILYVRDSVCQGKSCLFDSEADNVELTSYQQKIALTNNKLIQIE